jgi:5-methylcytosine-specific restriction endonuclease McrA
MSGIKRCPLCEVEKSLDEFGRWKGQPDGIAWACKPCYRAYRKGWADANRERKRELDRKLHTKHVEKRREKNRLYSLTHREQRNATQAKRRAAKLGAVHEPYDRIAIYHRDKGVCHICGEHVWHQYFHIDHIVPLARGGSDTPNNVALAHPACNHAKGAKV